MLCHIQFLYYVAFYQAFGLKYYQIIQSYPKKFFKQGCQNHTKILKIRPENKNRKILNYNKK